MKIISISYNDLGISWGPAIHYLELWNGVVSNTPEVEILGLAPSWTGLQPILPVHFKLIQYKMPAIAKGRQIIYDFCVAWMVFLKSSRQDIVYLRHSKFHVFTAFALVLRRNRLVLEFNGLSLDDSISARRSWIVRKFLRWQEKMLVRRACGIISVSHGITVAIQDSYHPSARLITLKNGVGSHFFDGDKLDCDGLEGASTRKTILYVGTFTPWDGAARITELAIHFPDVDFCFIGDGPERKAIEDSATKNMKFIGKVSYAELPIYYRKAHAGIVLYEAKRHKRVHLSSLKTLEYLASALPVFTTNVPGQEFIADMKCGVLATEENLLENFRVFLDNIDTYRLNAIAARSIVFREHSWESVANKTITFINNLNK